MVSSQRLAVLGSQLQVECEGWRANYCGFPVERVGLLTGLSSFLPRICLPPIN